MQQIAEATGRMGDNPHCVRMVERRVRKPNFTDPEVECLIQLFSRHRHVLDRRMNQSVPYRTKSAVWKLIASEVDARNPAVHRTESEIRKKWKELKLCARRDVMARRRGQGKESPKESRYTRAVLAALAGRDMTPGTGKQDGVEDSQTTQSPAQTPDNDLEVTFIKEEPPDDPDVPADVSISMATAQPPIQPLPLVPSTVSSPQDMPVIGSTYSLQVPSSSPLPTLTSVTLSRSLSHDLDMTVESAATDAIEVDSDSDSSPRSGQEMSRGRREVEVDERSRSQGHGFQGRQASFTRNLPRPGFGGRGRPRGSPGRSRLFQTEEVVPVSFQPVTSHSMDPQHPVDLSSRDLHPSGVMSNGMAAMSYPNHAWNHSTQPASSASHVTFPSRPLPALEVAGSGANDVSVMMDYHLQSSGRSRLLGLGSGGLISPSSLAGLTDRNTGGQGGDEEDRQTVEQLYRRLLAAEVARAESEVARNEEMVRKMALERHKLSLEIRLLEKQLSQ